ncbi:centlein isoform X2 [Brachionus plicatilis]|uniref:Centlein isoform X2 n=1 Tax=Brachionus plicatilis TaxID=10195 RepID=A0A3M7QVV4_BRAPC|nr:centlein isoform X2 [Brachionus plicatilis]
MNQVLADTTLNNYINEFSMTEASLNSTTASTSNASTSVCTITNIPFSEQAQPLTNKIKYLEEELANAKADKEFVWSLWKQLQSSNPNLTNAIGQVVQREKEKSETKDRKVLEILKIKDRKLEENEKTICSLNSDIGNLQSRIKNSEFELVARHEEIELLKKNVKTSEDKEQMYEQIIRLRDDKLEKLVKDNEQEKIYLLNKVSDLGQEIEAVRFECEKKSSELEVRSLELRTVSENYEKLLRELNHFKESIDQSLKLENDKLRSELKQKIESFEKLRLEFESLEAKMKSNLECMNQQDKLIRQLKQIQNDQQNTILSQKNTYEVLDSENLSVKKMYNDLLNKFESFVQQDKSAHLIAKCEKLEAKEKVSKDLVKTKNNEIEKLKMELDMLKEKLGYAESIVSELNRKCELLSDNVINCHEYKKSVDKNQKRSKSQNARPAAECTDQSETESTNKIKYYQNLCDLKEKELSTLKTAHQRRLERLMSLEKENELLKQQLDLDGEEEAESKTASKIKVKGYKRVDSQLVCKELAVLRNKNEELEKENFRLKENLDDYKFKIDEQNEKIEALKFELNLNLKDQEKNLSKKNEIYEKSLNERREKCFKLESELAALKELSKDLNSKCASLKTDREKYLSMSNKLTLENKRLHKKWFELRKKENKFKLFLSQQIRKYSNENKKNSNEE